MKLFLLAVITSFAASVAASPASLPYAVHEKRDITASSSQWEPRRHVRLDRRTTIPMLIALTQRNVDNGHDFLMDVSHPSSANYGKHWSPEKVADMFAASDETISVVKSWLTSDGIVEDRITVSKSRTWIRFNATIQEAESLLKTEYKIYESSDKASVKWSLACDEYSVPLAVRGHIDFITPTIQFDAVLSKTEKRAEATTPSLGNMPGPKSEPVLYYTPEDPAKIDSSDEEVSFAAGASNASPTDLSGCNKDITPECLRALYNMPNGTLAKSSFAIVEYAPQSFIPHDLEIFLHNLNPWIPKDTQPAVDFIDGTKLQTGPGDFYLESNLDLQLAVGLVYPQPVTVYEVGDSIHSASFNNFLDAIDATYCTVDGGDDSSVDGVYPDTEQGGYNGHDCGTIKPASVISTSYGYNEADLGSKYMTRQCNEYMKLGLQGVTILYSTGDFGVAGNGGRCCVSPNCASGALNDGKSGFFNPAAAPACPYVTAVGATQIAPSASVDDPEVAATFSAGGFSNLFKIPDYQKNAVGNFLSKHEPNLNSSLYASSGNARAFPDISANGVNILTVLNGTYTHAFGTSASTPIVASLFTLINEQLIEAGKPVVGFVNPVLYENPGAMNDITVGSNPGCGTKGFQAVEGWDPVTGLGTPDYKKLLKVFMGLGSTYS